MIFWIVINVLITIAAVLGTLFVTFANGMSDAPEQPFQGTGIIVAMWAVVVVFWLGFAFG